VERNGLLRVVVTFRRASKAVRAFLLVKLNVGCGGNRCAAIERPVVVQRRWRTRRLVDLLQSLMLLLFRDVQCGNLELQIPLPVRMVASHVIIGMALIVASVAIPGEGLDN
jgi:hypothetical protein